MTPGAGGGWRGGPSWWVAWVGGLVFAAGVSTAETETVAAETVAEEAVLVSQRPHAGTLGALAVVPGKPFLITGGREGTVRFWDERSGRASLYLKVGTGRQVVGLAASAIQGELYVADQDSYSVTGSTRVRRFDLVSKRWLQTYEGHPGTFRPRLVLSPDEQILAAIGGGQLTLWRTATGERWASLSAQGLGLTFLDPHRILFQPDDRVVVADLRNGRMRTVFERARGSDLALSPDRRWVAHCHDDRVTLWSFEAGELIASPEPLLGGTRCRFLRFAPEGRQLLIGTREGRIYRLQEPTWTDQTGLLSLGSLHGLEFSTSGDLVTAANQAEVWTRDPLAEKHRLGSQGARITALALSPSRELIASGDTEGRVRLFNLGLGEIVRLGQQPEPPEELQWPDETSSARVVTTLGPGERRPHDPISALHFTHRQNLIVAHRDGPLTLWDTLAESQLWSTDFRADAVALGLGGSVAAVGPDGLGIWRLVDDDTSLRSVARVATPPGSRFVALDPSGRRLAVRGTREVWIYETESGAIRSRFEAETSGTDWIGFAADDRLEDLRGRLLTVRDPSTGAVLDRHPLEIRPRSVARLSGRDAWVLGGSEGDLGLLDLGHGGGEGGVPRKAPRPIESHEASVDALALSPEGDLLLSGSEDGTVKIWRLPSFDLLATWQTVGEDGWLVSSPQGFFDGDESGWRDVRFHLRSSPFVLYEPEQFFDLFFEPGLLGPVVAEGQSVAESLAARDDSRASLDLRRYLDSAAPTVRFVTPEPSMWRETTQGGGGFWELVGDDRRIPSVVAGQVDAMTLTQTPRSEREVEVELEVVDRGRGAQDCRLFRNRTQVGFFPGPVPDSTLRQTLRLQEGFNRLQAYCFNQDGVRSPQAELLLYGAESLARRGRAQVLAIGVNDYRNTAFEDLSFALADAEAMAETLARGFASVPDLDPADPLVLTDLDATKANILAALSRLAGKPEPANGWPRVVAPLRPLEPEDVLVVFFAGHGLTRGDRYYLVPHDDPKAIRDSQRTDDWISDRELELAFLDIASSRMALIIDACQAGAAIRAEDRRRGPMNSRGLAQLAYEKGMLILAASQSHAAAVEDRELGHGILTFALVDPGWKENAAERWAPQNQLTLLEWFLFAEGQVPILYRDGLERGGELLFPPSDPEPQRPRIFNRSGDRASQFVVRVRDRGE